MKCTISILMTFLLTSLMTTTGFAQQATLSIPITVPPPTPITVPVQQKVTVGALTYLATGTLTLTPVATTGANPLPALGNLPPTASLPDMPPHDWPPVIQRFTDPLGVELSASVPLGKDVVLAGMNFGDGGGMVFIGSNYIPAKTWADDKVTLTVPATLAATDDYSVWTVLRSGGAYNTAWGPALKP